MTGFERRRIYLPTNIITSRHISNSRSDPHSSHVNAKTQRLQHVIEQDAVLHAIPASSSLIGHDFLEEHLWIKRHGVRGRVVEYQVLVGHAADLVDV